MKPLKRLSLRWAGHRSKATVLKRSDRGSLRVGNYVRPGKISVAHYSLIANQAGELQPGKFCRRPRCCGADDSKKLNQRSPALSCFGTALPRFLEQLPGIPIRRDFHGSLFWSYLFTVH
jgi:hypothetical protein